MKERWMNRLDIVVRLITRQRSMTSEELLRLIETVADGLSPERFAGAGIGLNATAFSKTWSVGGCC
jgi:hypothetical protein